MKSIKEKSNEYAREFIEPFVLYYTKDEVRQFEAQHEDSFEAGANYVLDEIERIVNSAIENKSMTIPTWRINYIIKQLKK